MPLNRIVRITARASTAGDLPVSFGRGLFLRPGVKATELERFEAIGAGIGVYSSHTSIAEDYASSEDASLAALKWFQQEPYPAGLLVGTTYAANLDSRVYGGTPSAIAVISALAATSTVTLGGEDSTALDFTGDSTLAAVAATLEGGLSGFSGISVTVADNKLVVEVDPDEDLGDGFDDDAVSQALGLDPDSATVRRGIEAETVSDGLSRMNGENSDWYFLVLSEDFVDTAEVENIADWAAANDKMLILDSHQSGALDSTNTTAYLNILSAEGSRNVVGIYSVHEDYKAVSLAARFSSVNFDGESSLITAKFRQLPGTAPDDQLTEAQEEILSGRNINYLKTVGPRAIVQEGRSFGGWIDVQYWIDWFTDRVRTDLFNALLNANTIPQTEEGTAALKGVVEAVCALGVTNGGLAPGQLSPALSANVRTAINDDRFDGGLSNGYLVYIGAVADQSQSQREARKAPAVKVWTKGSGAIHFIELDLTFEA